MSKNFTICILVTLIIFGSTTQVFANNTLKKDSVSQSRQKKLQIDDIDILLGLATKVYYSNPERSLQYAETALNLAKKQNDDESKIKVLNVIGDIYKKLDYDKMALPNYLEAYKLAKKLKKSALIAQCSKALGKIYYKLNDIDSTTHFYSQYLNISQTNGNREGIADATLLLGNTYWLATNYDKALEFYFKSLTIFEEIKNKSGVSTALNRIGSLYTVIGDKHNSMFYLQKAMQTFNNYDDTESLSELYFRLGIAYENFDKTDSALYYLDLAKILFDSLHFVRQSAYADKYKANIYFKEGYTQKAIALAQQTLDVFTKYNYRWGMADIYNDLSIYNLSNGDYSAASKNLQIALKLANELNSLELLKNTYLNMSKLYADQYNYAKALSYYQKFQVMNDSALNREKNSRIAELQAKYETNKKENELRLKNEEITRNIEQIKKQRRNLYLFGIATIIILLMSFGLFRQYRLLSQKGQKIERINAELDHRVKERTSALRLSQYSIDHAVDIIFWINPEGDLVYANNSASKTLGYPREEIIDLSITKIIPKFSVADWKDIWELIKERRSQVFETQFKKKTGEKFPVEITLNYIFHDEKEYAFAFIRDISDRRTREENLKRAKEKAEEADKLKSAFLANMSHEIRTPMNAIIGFSDLLINDETEQEEKQEFANIIKNSSDTLLKLIDDIIDISIIEAGQLKMNNKEFNLNAVLKELIRFYQEEKLRIKKSQIDVRLNESNFDDKIYLNTDPVRFRQVIINLVGKALKFTENGFIEIGYYKDSNSKVNIYVQDTGIGIQQDKLSTIFDRFNKVHDSKKLYGGTGLGLTISKKLVEQMDGDLTVESTVNQGSTFKITLQYFIQTTKNNKEIKPSTNGKYNWKEKSLLIVEDVESNYQYLATILKKTGINIYWAQDGEQALNFCVEKCPDVVLMDIQLPNMDGYEVTKRLLSKFPQMPIIAQTAYAFSDEKAKILNAGCVDYVTKPIDKSNLYDTMNKYL